MSTHNTCFRGEIRKISAFFGALSVAMLSKIYPVKILIRLCKCAG